MKKFITLMAAAAMTITASAETATFGASDATGKDTDIVCQGFTVPGTYNPGGTSKADVYDGDKGMKLRANKGADANELMLTVNEGLTITDLTMGMVVNDANGTFSLSGIAVDGTAVADFTSIELPNTSNAAGKAVVNLSGIQATQNIVFTYDFEGYEGKNKQVYIAGTVTYSEGGAEVGGSAFEWEPMIQSPSVYGDVTSLQSLETLLFQCFVEGVAPTEVMPLWQDEDGNEIKAVSGGQDDWNPTQFIYQFNISDFKSNGEYVLVFPEGMLLNAAGEKSAKVQIPYTLDIPELAPAMFEDFKVLSMSPDLNEPQAIWQNQLVTINTNHNDAIGLTKIVVTNVSTGEYVGEATNFTVYRELGDNSEISFEIVGPYKFFTDNTYKAEITFYNATDEYTSEGPAKIVDRVSYEFTGRVEGYKYSDIVLESVIPVPGAYVISDPSQAVFTYTFSGPVSVYKAYSPLGQYGQQDYPESCLSSNEEKTVWTLDLSDQEFIKTLDAALPLTIRARDLEGNQLQGNSGVETLSGFEYEWECEIAAPAIEILVPAKEAVIERLTEVVVKSVNGEAMEYVGYPAATIQGRDRSILGELYYDPDTTPSADGAIHFTMWYPEGAWEPVPLDIEAEGVYSIFFPHGAFQFGEQFDAKQSHSAGTSFEISNSIVTPPSEQATFEYVSVDPASGSNVVSLEQIVLTYSEMPAPIEFSVDVYKEGEEAPVTVADLDIDWDNDLLILVNLRQPITEDGTYTLTFKEGIIGNDPYAMSNGATGICNPEFKLTYIVGNGSAVGSVEAADADAVYYDLAGRRVLNPDKGIYIVNGKKVVK